MKKAVVYDPQLDLRFIRRMRNTGPPISDVITPAGSPAMVRFLATQSASSSIMAPAIADAGRRNLLSDPRNILQTCGATSPMKLIVPVKHTATDVNKDTKIISSIRVLRGSTPRVLAFPSLRVRMLSFLENNCMVMRHRIATATTIR